MRYTRTCLLGTLIAALAVASTGRTQDKKAPPALDPEAAAELRARFAGRTPEEVRAAFGRLTDQWAARKGVLEAAYQHFAAQRAELTRVRTRLAALKEPEARAGGALTRPEDVDDEIRAAERTAEYRAARVPLIEATVAATRALLNRGADFDRAAAAADRLHARVEFARTLAPTLVPADLAKAQSDLAARLKVIGPEVQEARDRARDDLNGLESALASARAAAAAATKQLDELRLGRESALARLAYEDQVHKMAPAPLADEFDRLSKALAEKRAAFAGNAADHNKATAAAAAVRAELAAIKEPPLPAAVPAGAPPLEAAARELFSAQQYLGARLRTADERAEKTKAVLAALDEEEKRAVARATTLEDARRTAARLAAVAGEIGRRVGRGDLDPAKAPPGLADPGVDGAALAAELAAVQQALAKLRDERDRLRKPDPDATNLRALTAALFGHVSARLERHTELKKLVAEYAAPRRERPEAEQKRLDRRAADRAATDAGPWEPVLALDRSKPALARAELVEAYYQELIDLEDKEDNLKLRREALEDLVDRTGKEAADVAKARTLLERTGGARDWDGWLAARLAPTGLKAEAATYHDELARLATLGGANARRVQALTGAPAPESGAGGPGQARQPAAAGAVAAARAELREARVRGLATTGIKIALVLLAALVLPLLAVRAVRRGIRGGSDEAGNPSPVLGPLRRVLKLTAWAAALAVALSILGFDVTALVVALAIVALAGALTARSVIADALGAMAVFADRRFKVGDVVRVGGGEPARVVGLTWRSTALKNANGLVVSVPNRSVTEATVENLSRETETYDALAVTISTDKDAGKVIGVIRTAMAQCKNLSPDHGVTVLSYTQRGPVKVVQYRFWWFLKDYEARNKTRDEVFARIAMGLAQEDMTGIEVTLA